MKRMTRSLALLLLLATAAPVVGQEEGKGETEEEAKARFIKVLTRAYELEEAGREARSPMMLVTAAGLFRMLRGNEKLLSEMTVEPEVEEGTGDEKGEDAPKEKQEVKLDFGARAEELFEAAQGLTDGRNNVAITATINAIKADEAGVLVWKGDKGNIKGPQAINRFIAGGATHTYKFPFAGGLPAAVGFKSTGPCAVTIVRTDNDTVIAAGNVVVAQRHWVPDGKKAKVMFTVRIKNLTRKPVQYMLMTN